MTRGRGAGRLPTRVRPAEADDWPRIARIRRLAFRWPGELEVQLPGMWVLDDGRGVQACARLESEGQWFGGRIVPTALLSSVAVAPEARGRGVGSELLDALLHEARASGLAATTLYPSALRPYRRAGFEIGGHHVTLAADTRDLPLRGEELAEEASADDLAMLCAAYDRLAATRDGPIARSELWWRTRVLASRPPTPREDPDLEVYVVRSAAGATGYTIFRQAADGPEPYGGRIVCQDLVWLEEGAARSLLGLMGGARPLVTSVEWPGSADDPLGALLDDPPRVAASEPWMSRLLDPAAAIEARGYPPALTADLRFRVADPLDPSWSVGLRVRIEAGRAHVTSARRPAPSVDVGTLSAILSGGLDPASALRLGRLGASPDELQGFRALYPAGPRWIGDRF